jgi:hypothetical protein
MPDCPLWKLEEEQLLDCARDLLQEEGFPNPERSGCPGKEILRELSRHSLEHEDAAFWADHMASCSPCFGEYEIFRRHALKRKRLQLAALSVGLLVAITCISHWTALPAHLSRLTNDFLGSSIFHNTRYRDVRVDLRNRLLLRGEEETTNRQSSPAELPHARVRLTLYLPVASPEGAYEVKLTRSASESLLKTAGVAHIENYITVLRVRLDLSTLPRGFYLLGVRRRQADWEYYRVMIQ